MANSDYRFSLANDSVAGMAKILQTLESKEYALKAAELAKLLGVTRQHIYKMAAASAIPSFRIGAAVGFDPKEVAELPTRRMPHAVTPPSLNKPAVLPFLPAHGSCRRTCSVRSLPCELLSSVTCFQP